MLYSKLAQQVGFKGHEFFLISYKVKRGGMSCTPGWCCSPPWPVSEEAVGILSGSAFPVNQAEKKEHKDRMVSLWLRSCVLLSFILPFTFFHPCHTSSRLTFFVEELLQTGQVFDNPSKYVFYGSRMKKQSFQWQLKRVCVYWSSRHPHALWR